MRRSVVGEECLDEESHLALLNEAIPVLINRLEGLIEPGLVVVVGRRAVGEHGLQEALGLLSVEGATVVLIKLAPDLVDGLGVDALLLDLSGESSCESAVGDENRVVDEDLEVAWEALPSNGLFILKCLAVDDDDLLLDLWSLRCGGGDWLTILIRGRSFGSQLELWLLRLGLRDVDTDLAASLISRVTFVGLDSTVAASIGHHTSDTESSLIAGIRDPCDVNETVVDGCKWVHDHTSISILAIVNHHQGSADASLAHLLVIDGQLVSVLDKATAESLHVSRKRES